MESVIKFFGLAFVAFAIPFYFLKNHFLITITRETIEISGVLCYNEEDLSKND